MNELDLSKQGKVMQCRIHRAKMAFSLQWVTKFLRSERFFKDIWTQTTWNIENTFDLRLKDLSTKWLERFHGKWWKQKSAYSISVWRMAGILMYAKRYTVETYFAKYNQSFHLTSTDAVRLLLTLHRQRHVLGSCSIVCIYVIKHQTLPIFNLEFDLLFLLLKKKC